MVICMPFSWAKYYVLTWKKKRLKTGETDICLKSICIALFNLPNSMEILVSHAKSHQSCLQQRMTSTIKYVESMTFSSLLVVMLFSWPSLSLFTRPMNKVFHGGRDRGQQHGLSFTKLMWL